MLETPSNPGTMILTHPLHHCTQLSFSSKQSLHLSSSLNPTSISTIQHNLPLDSLLHLFKNHNFTQSQITKIITKSPKLIHTKSLPQKLEYLESLPLSKPDIAEIVYLYNTLLCRSLNGEIIPTFDFIKALAVESGIEFVDVLRSYSLVVNAKVDFDLTVKPNILHLKNVGVPGENICKLFVFRRKVLRLKNVEFVEIVRVVYDMKIDPRSLTFVLAVGTMGSISKLDWEERLDAYRSFGWSEEEFVSAYKLQPQCMSISEEKIRKMMGFYVNELGLTALEVCKYPNLMLVSLEKRIIPRCSVLLILMAYGLVEKDFKLMAVLNQTNERFEKKYLNRYPEIIPKLMKAYYGVFGYPKLEKMRSLICCNIDQELW